MKCILMLFQVSFILLLTACSYHHDGAGSLTVSESDHEYEILAEYPGSNTARVEQYMNEKIGNRNNISFVPVMTDEEITLNDGTKFYMTNKPGVLKINLDKDQNSRSSFNEIKSLGEGLKSFLDVSGQ